MNVNRPLMTRIAINVTLTVMNMVGDHYLEKLSKPSEPEADKKRIGFCKD